MHRHRRRIRPATTSFEVVAACAHASRTSARCSSPSDLPDETVVQASSQTSNRNALAARNEASARPMAKSNRQFVTEQGCSDLRGSVSGKRLERIESGPGDAQWHGCDGDRICGVTRKSTEAPGVEVRCLEPRSHLAQIYRIPGSREPPVPRRPPTSQVSMISTADVGKNITCVSIAPLGVRRGCPSAKYTCPHRPVTVHDPAAVSPATADAVSSIHRDRPAIWGESACDDSIILKENSAGCDFGQRTWNRLRATPTLTHQARNHRPGLLSMTLQIRSSSIRAHQIAEPARDERGQQLVGC